MDTAKADLTRDFFNQIESQVQFGDTKASLLVAGDAILLAIIAQLAGILAGCSSTAPTASCPVWSPEFLLAVASGLLLVGSVACALWAARPARIHERPPRQLFLLSYVGGMSQDEFIEEYRGASSEQVLLDALVAVHGKAQLATKKFRWLKRAIHATLASLTLIVLAIASALISR